MEMGRYEFTLIPADDDPDPASEEFQTLVQMTRDGFSGGGLTVVAPTTASQAPGLIGEVLIPMTQAVGPVIGAVIGSIVTYKVSRRVKIKSGQIEIEASNAEQAKELFDLALSSAAVTPEVKKS